MKLTYMLWNKSCTTGEIPHGEAWKWIHHVEDGVQMRSIFEKLKKKIRDNKLTLANFQIDQQGCADRFFIETSLAYRDPIVYDEFISPSRVISMHTDSL